MCFIIYANYLKNEKIKSYGGDFMVNFKKNLTNDFKEAQYAAGMNFDVEEIEPFLNHLSKSILDIGLTQKDIKLIQEEIESTNEHNKLIEFGTFNVTYKGKQSKIRIQVEIHIEDEDKEVVMYIYSSQELVDIIDEEMLKVEGQREV